MRAWSIFVLALAGFFIVDHQLKALFLEGYYREGRCIDLVLHLNRGVAFSMFTFLGPWLKWVQAVIIVGIVWFFIKERYIVTMPFASAMIIAGALGNLYDRFTQGAVVDYVAWHCGFTWPVFNLADVLIDAGIVLIVWSLWRRERQRKV